MLFYPKELFLKEIYLFTQPTVYIDYLNDFGLVGCFLTSSLNEHVGTLKYADYWYNRLWALESITLDGYIQVTGDDMFLKSTFKADLYKEPGSMGKYTSGWRDSGFGGKFSVSRNRTLSLLSLYGLPKCLWTLKLPSTECTRQCRQRSELLLFYIRRNHSVRGSTDSSLDSRYVLCTIH